MSTAGDITGRVSSTLFDETNVRWSEAELLEALSDAQREIVLMKPSANTVEESVQLAPGTLQDLPAGGVLLIDVLFNSGADGNSVGPAITQIDRTVLSTAMPNWRLATGAASRHYLYDDRTPKTFEVYPPQPDPAEQVVIAYSKVPAELSNTTDLLELDEIYNTPLYYLTLARAYSKTTGTQDFNKAAMYQQLGSNLVLGRKITKQEIHPEQQSERVKR